MVVRISYWYGRLGNNIQQCAVATIVAELLQNSFEAIDHELISPEKEVFGDSLEELSGRWFFWDGPEKEVSLPVDYINKNMRRICRDHILSRLRIPECPQVSDDTIVIHIRSGDIFDQVFSGGHIYVPNPLHYYLLLIEKFDRAIIVTEPDTNNPVVEALRQHKKVIMQSRSVEEDFGCLLAAKNLASSGIGTFCLAAALCSQNIENFYCSDLMLSEHLNYGMLLDSDVKVSVLKLRNYFVSGEWQNTEEQRKFILEYAI